MPAIAEQAVWTTMSDLNSTKQFINGTTGSVQDQHTQRWVNIVFIVAACLCLIFSGFALVALCRSRNLPQTARFLSSSLLVFDCATTFTYMLRKFFNDSNVLNLLTLLGLGWSNAAFINVASMAVERLVVFQWPYFYLRQVSHTACIRAFTVLIVCYLLLWTGEWAYCSVTATGFWNQRRCFGPIVTRHIVSTFSCSAVISCACFMWVIVLILKHRARTHPETASYSRHNRSTAAVFLCCLNYLITAVINIILIFTISSITIVVRRTILDILYMLNGLVDTVVYVLWYRECRMEMMKMLSICLPSMKEKAEKLRLEIFGIGTHSQGTNANGSS